jgi:hypothetical protein
LYLVVSEGRFFYLGLQIVWEHFYSFLNTLEYESEKEISFFKETLQEHKKLDSNTKKYNNLCTCYTLKK